MGGKGVSARGRCYRKQPRTAPDGMRANAPAFCFCVWCLCCFNFQRLVVFWRITPHVTPTFSVKLLRKSPHGLSLFSTIIYGLSCFSSMFYGPVFFSQHVLGSITPSPACLPPPIPCPAHCREGAHIFFQHVLGLYVPFPVCFRDGDRDLDPPPQGGNSFFLPRGQCCRKCFNAQLRGRFYCS